MFLTNLLIDVGISRDSWLWFWGKLLSVATLITSGTLDLTYWAQYVGLHPTTTQVHIAQATAIALLWLSGQYSSSPLFSAANAPAMSNRQPPPAAAWLLPVLLLVLPIAGCAHARHLAVVADASFAQAVFALDDAELQACSQQVLTQAQCDAAGPKIRQALVDVKAVTQAIQATPKNVAVPKALPDLLADLTQVQAVLGPAGQIPQAVPVLGKVQSAIDQAIAILRLYAQFSGGQN